MSSSDETSPRTRPLLAWDGDCSFCRTWVERLRVATGDRVEYVTAAEAAPRLPEVPRARFDESVVLRETDGTIHFGADAAFRAVSRMPGLSWLPAAVRAVPGLSAASEAAYGWVARHRSIASRFSRLLWGRHSAPPTWRVAPWAFLRLLGVVYLVAFASLWVQVHGLIGSGGILPVEPWLELVRSRLGDDATWRVPTILWIDSSDAMLHAACALGVVAALLVVVDVATPASLVVAWGLYLSLVNGGQAFLSFQWDALLLETGLLAVFLAAPRLRAQRPGPSSTIARWLGWWLLFRLMTLSGAVKLASGDEAWHRGTALAFHHETQPLPTPIGWLLHQAPDVVHAAMQQATFGIELLIPFLYFAPRRLRHLAATLTIGLMLAIAASGNYGFFNLLTIALAVLLYDDAAWPRAWKRLLVADSRREEPPFRLAWSGPWPVALPLAFALIALPVTSLRYVERLGADASPPAALEAVSRWSRPFHAFNSYGLFAIMTTRRPELVFEGSRDGTSWRPYVFRFKPGDPRRAPPLVAPHQPRLDWQCWFAALSTWRGRQGSWVRAFEARLLEGSPEVLSLLAEDPFAGDPPRQLRVSAWDYRFGAPSDLVEDGLWWRRERLGPWAPVLTRRALERP